jgi:1L-myo-inositol 1-phosphate cytidylyltransferase
VTGLIIAAGMGSRMAGLTDSKPLLPVGPRPLIEWVMSGAQRAGVSDFVVVTGYNEAKLRARVKAAAAASGWPVRFVHNDRWREPNGLSVQAAAALVDGPFFLLMSDHLFDPGILELLAAQPLAAGEAMLAVDTRVQANPWVDMDDVTRVRCGAGFVQAIGKGLAEYNAFDTGIFRCTPGLFAALAESGRRGDFSLSGGMRVLAETKQAKALAIGDRFWLDVDDEAALRKAEAWLARERA